MLKKWLIVMMWGVLIVQVPKVGISQDRRHAHAYETKNVHLTIHRDSSCDSPVLKLTERVRLATGETLTICFKPNSSSYIYIINESADGTYIAYPQSADQLRPFDTQQTYTFDIVGDPGPEILTFFVSKNPIAHLDDAIRRGGLQLSRSQLFHGNRSEAIRCQTNPLSTINEKSFRESDRSPGGSFWLVDLEPLEMLLRSLLSDPCLPTEFPSTGERVRLNSDLSNITAAGSGPIGSTPKRKAMVLEFFYDHHSPNF